jgi:uncharacterized protein YdeI (BOF family)
MDGRDTIGGGEVIGEIRFERAIGVEVSPEDNVSMDGYLDSKLSSWIVEVLACRLDAMGDVV